MTTLLQGIQQDPSTYKQTCTYKHLFKLDFMPIVYMGLPGCQPHFFPCCSSVNETLDHSHEPCGYIVTPLVTMASHPLEFVCIQFGQGESNFKPIHEIPYKSSRNCFEICHILPATMESRRNPRGLQQQIEGAKNSRMVQGNALDS